MRTARADTTDATHVLENLASLDERAIPAQSLRAHERRRQISITGMIGSGKSTVGHLIAQLLGWEYLSSGAAQRGIAQSLSLSTLELNRAAETDTNFDNRLDQIIAKLKSKNDIVVDLRMAWYFLAESFKVSLMLSPEIAARRILRDPMRHAEEYTDEMAATSDILARAESERKRFQSAYDIDIANINNFDLVIDTTDIVAKTVGNLIFANYVLWQERMAHAAAIVSVHRLLPTQDAQMLDDGFIKEAQTGFSRVGFPLSAAPCVLYCPPNYYLIGDHHLVCAAIRSNMSIVPAALQQMTEADERLIVEAATITRIRDWETACGCKCQVN